MKSPLSLILLDVDHFKSFNDRHGHLGGDDCLKKIGNLLKCFAKRPGDLCARFGGDEFALILGNTDMESSAQMAHGLLAAIREVNTAQAPSAVVTASLGVATMYPSDDLSEKTLVELADQALYGAKDNGRNIVFFNKERAPQGYCTK